MIPEQHTAAITDWLNLYAKENSLVPDGFRLKVQLELEEIQVPAIQLIDGTQKVLLQTPLRKLGLSCRTLDVLRLVNYPRSELGTVKDLLDWIEKNMDGDPRKLPYRVKNFGPKSYNELRTALAKIGFSVDSW